MFLLNKFMAVLFNILHDLAEGTEYKCILKTKMDYSMDTETCLVNHASENV